MRFQTRPRGRRCDLVVSKIFRTLHSAIAVIYGGSGLCGTAHQGVCLGHRQHLAALRTLFDWLVIGQVVAFNLASSVRGPKHVVKTGKTPVVTAAEAHALLDTIDVGTVAGQRDRALLGLMVYSFARVGAAVGMRVTDY